MRDLLEVPVGDLQLRMDFENWKQFDKEYLSSNISIYKYDSEKTTWRETATTFVQGIYCEDSERIRTLFEKTNNESPFDANTFVHELSKLNHTGVNKTSLSKVLFEVATAANLDKDLIDTFARSMRKPAELSSPKAPQFSLNNTNGGMPTPFVGDGKTFERFVEARQCKK